MTRIRFQFRLRALTFGVMLAGATFGAWVLQQRAWDYRQRATKYAQLEQVEIRNTEILRQAAQQSEIMAVRSRAVQRQSSILTLVFGLSAAKRISDSHSRDQESREQKTRRFRAFADSGSRKATYYAALRCKYDRAAHYPWLLLPADPAPPP